MFRIQQVYDATTHANRDLVSQVQQIMREQFPVRSFGLDTAKGVNARRFFTGLAENWRSKDAD